MRRTGRSWTGTCPSSWPCWQMPCAGAQLTGRSKEAGKQGSKGRKGGERCQDNWGAFSVPTASFAWAFLHVVTWPHGHPIPALSPCTIEPLPCPPTPPHRPRLPPTLPIQFHKALFMPITFRLPHLILTQGAPSTLPPPPLAAPLPAPSPLHTIHTCRLPNPPNPGTPSTPH